MGKGPTPQQKGQCRHWLFKPSDPVLAEEPEAIWRNPCGEDIPPWRKDTSEPNSITKGTCLLLTRNMSGLPENVVSGAVMIVNRRIKCTLCPGIFWSVRTSPLDAWMSLWLEIHRSILALIHSWVRPDCTGIRKWHWEILASLGQAPKWDCPCRVQCWGC